MHKLLIVAIAAQLSGCAVMTPIEPSAKLDGHQVRSSAIEVLEDFTFRPALYSVTYPAGLYLPAFQDETHYCFASTQQIVGRNLFGGITVRGGLCVARDSWDKRMAYIDDGNVYKFVIDVPVRTRVVDR